MMAQALWTPFFTVRMQCELNQLEVKEYYDKTRTILAILWRAGRTAERDF